ncbi:DUF4469 domain-containing protein [Mucilaginibacter sp.]|uniref:DUF4469 domain-containing protein n=1 Tax=Mucilaginibacter sp. TaxID=1882438 RepID=UPI003D10BB3C
MKNSIKLTALFLLASTGLFAATSKTLADKAPVKDEITFSTLASNKGVSIRVDKNTPGKAIVIIYDQDKNVLRKDVFTSNKPAEKAYILNKLENGDYTIEVTSNKQVIKKDIHVYDEYKIKTFIVKQ